MKITAIKQQVKRADRYSIFVDNKYCFSLSEAALLNSKLVSGQILTVKQVTDLKRLSGEDKLYQQALRYAALRPRSEWEVKFYLERKQASPALVKQILNKLSIIQMVSDAEFARSFVHDRRLLRPTSRRKMEIELRKKHVSQAIIDEVLGNEIEHEIEALKSTIVRKRRQSKYQDDQKLMQYLARQGYNYSDIKSQLKSETND